MTKKPTKKTSKAPAPKAVAPEPTAPATVMVKVGPNGAAGRLMVGNTVYDGITPQAMKLADYENLKARYDLRIVEAKED